MTTFIIVSIIYILAGLAMVLTMFQEKTDNRWLKIIVVTLGPIVFIIMLLLFGGKQLFGRRPKSDFNNDPEFRKFLTYEIAGSWWSSYISWDWMEDISAKYFTNKARRKYRRYLIHKTFLNRK